MTVIKYNIKVNIWLFGEKVLFLQSHSPKKIINKTNDMENKKIRLNANPVVAYLQKPAAVFTRADLIRYVEEQEIKRIMFFIKTIANEIIVLIIFFRKFSPFFFEKRSDNIRCYTSIFYSII